MPNIPEEIEEDHPPRNLLHRLPELSGRAWGIEPIAGGLTNRNFLLRSEGESYVLRVAGAQTGLLGIDRNQELICARSAAEGGVGPEVVAFLSDPAVLVTHLVPGRVLTTELLREPTTLQRVAQTLRRCHNHPAPVEVAEFSPFASARRNLGLAIDRGVSIPDVMDQARERLAQIERELQTAEPPCLCHNDLLPANLIEDDQRVWIIDWEFAGRGDRFFDLCTLAANGEFDEEQEKFLLATYFGEVRPHNLRKLKLMRLVSDLRESTWGYLQSALSTLHEPGFYLDYGHRHLARFLDGIEKSA